MIHVVTNTSLSLVLRLSTGAISGRLTFLFPVRIGKVVEQQVGQNQTAVAIESDSLVQ